MLRTIVVASSDVGISQNLARTLNEGAGSRTNQYRILAAAEGLEVLEEILGSDVDLLIAEIAPGAEEGIQLVGAARKTGCNGMLLSSGPVSNETILRAHIAGSEAILSKPSTESEWHELADFIRRGFFEDG